MDPTSNQEDDAAYDFFSEVIPSTSDENGVGSSKNEIKQNSRKILAKAFDLELSTSSDSVVSSVQQAVIDKLLSDAAMVLRCNDKNQSPNEDKSDEWIFSARGDDVDASNEVSKATKAPMFSSGYDLLTENTTWKEISKSEESTKSVIPLCCFNCEGAHNVAECPEPRDQARIRHNRNIYQQKYGTVGRPREKDAKFKKYVAGEISDTLREACGLRENELPPWVYEMRILGYPPGYARMLLKHVTKLAIYNEPADLREAEAKHKQNVMEFDPSAFVHFPGFNMPLPDGVVEEGHKYGYPPMQFSHMKENFLATHQTSHNGGKSSAGPREGSMENRGSSSSVIEISDDERVAAASLSTNSSKRNSRCSKSPSIEDLEDQHRRIQNELAGLSDEPRSKRQRLNSEGDSGNGGESAHQDEVIDLRSPESPPLSDVIIDDEITTPKQIPLNDSLDEGPSSSSKVVAPNISENSTPSTSRLIAVGTPVRSGFLQEARPQLESFSSGITPYSPQEECLARGPGYLRLKAMMKKKESEK